MARNKLTERQNQFVISYVQTRNATKSAIIAGYKETNADKIGPELLGKPWVKAAIDKKLRILAIRAEITQESILHDLEELKKRCLGIHPDHPDFLDINNAVKVMTEQCKILGFYSAEKHDVKTSFVISPNQRAELMEAAKAAKEAKQLEAKTIDISEDD